MINGIKIVITPKKQKMENYKILIRFPNRKMTAKEYILFSKNILLQLQNFANDFKTLYAWGSESNTGVYLKEDLSDFESVVFSQLNDTDIAYSNSDELNKKFTMDSKCFIGYSNSYSTNKDHKQKQITVTIGAGKENLKNEDMGILNFEFSKSLQTSLDLSYSLKLLEFSINLVNPYYGTIISNELRRKVSIDNENYWIGWINYFADKEVLSFLPTNINAKLLFDKGVIFWLSEEIPTSTNDEIVQKAIRIRENIKGILSNHVFIF
jgi:hypothetical protein